MLSRDLIKLIGCTAFFSVLLLTFYMATVVKKRYDEKTVFSSWRFKVKDIPNSYGRIYVKGHNSARCPWEIGVLKNLDENINPINFKKFQEVIFF